MYLTPNCTIISYFAITHIHIFYPAFFEKLILYICLHLLTLRVVKFKRHAGMEVLV